MEKKEKSREEIRVYADLLGFEMDEARTENLIPAFEDMMERGRRVDAKMRRKPYADLVPGNIYIH